jgi:hypothetical protein
MGYVYYPIYWLTTLLVAHIFPCYGASIIPRVGWCFRGFSLGFSGAFCRGVVLGFWWCFWRGGAKGEVLAGPPRSFLRIARVYGVRIFSICAGDVLTWLIVGCLLHSSREQNNPQVVLWIGLDCFAIGLD